MTCVVRSAQFCMVLNNTGGRITHEDNMVKGFALAMALVEFVIFGGPD